MTFLRGVLGASLAALTLVACASRDDDGGSTAKDAGSTTTSDGGSGTGTGVQPVTGEDGGEIGDFGDSGNESGNDASTTSDGGANDDAATGDASTGGGDSGTIDTCNDPNEPNDSADQATPLDDVEDSMAAQTLSAAIGSQGSHDGSDVDWYTYNGIDGTNTTTSADPWVQIQSTDTMEVCVWAARTDKSTPAAACATGTVTSFDGDSTNIPNVIGCCSTSGTVQIQNYGRTGSDDSSTVYIRVTDTTATETCTGYTMNYAFVH